MAISELPADIAEMSFEDATFALEEIVKEFESGDVKLEQAIENYSRGTALKRHCQNKLSYAQKKVEEFSLQANGIAKKEPLNNELPDDIAEMSFEEATLALEEIVKGLESGEVKLDQAIENYGRGAALKRHCANKLSDAQEKIEKISVDANGSLIKEPLDME